MKNLFNKVRFRALILLMLLCTLFSASVYGQDGFTVSGTVVDEVGVPLPGASIIEKGTTNGVVSDFDGNYSFEVANSNATLTISYIGFEAQEVPINGNSVINVTMQSTASTLVYKLCNRRVER